MPPPARAVGAARDMVYRAVAAKAKVHGEAFAMARLWRLALWGAAATAALVLVVLVSRSEAGLQRLGVAMASLSGHPKAPTGRRPFDAEAETRRLQDALQRIAEDRDRLTTRVASLEQNLDVVTGSVTQQLDAVRKSAPLAPWPTEVTAAPTPPATIAATVAPAAFAAPPTGLPLGPHDAAAPGTEPAAEPDPAYGVDLGGAQTVQALRARWQAVRSVHPQLFDGLRPIMAVRDVAGRDPARPGRVELRLIVGPLASADAVAQLCASLATARVACQPAVFDGQRLALN